MKEILLLVVLGGFFLPSQAKQDTIYEKRHYTVAVLREPPEIDGWLDEKAWEAVPWAGEFQMHEPYDDRTPSQDTRFKVAVDNEFIYVAIRAFDTAPDSIVSRLTRRDDIDGDMVAFQFDSYHDLQTAFTFFASASGSKMDVYQSQDGDREDETWNPIWWVKTRIDDLGWTMEAKVPFSQLRFDKNSGGIWGFQVAREVFRNNETSLWQPISRETPGWVHRIGELHGLAHINPKKQAEVSPYAVAGSEWYDREPGNPYREEGRSRRANAGVDAKVGLTNNFTLDLSVNPDFGQVEADPSQVNLTAYETYFREQRPFFIEGQNLFDFDLGVTSRSNLFYSRRIGRRPQHEPDLEEGAYASVPGYTTILGAAKITGKTREGLSVGVMESVTQKEFAEIDANGVRRTEAVEPLTNYFAGRVSKEFDKGNTILGGMFTSANRFLEEESQLADLHAGAQTGGLDFSQFFKDRKYVFSMSAYASRVSGTEEALLLTQQSSVHYFQRPGAGYVSLDSTRTQLTGFGGGLSFGKQSGRFRYMLFLNMNSPGLELNDLGFLTSTDEIMQIFWMGYRFNEPFSIFRNANLNFNQWNVWDFGGNHQNLGFNINGHAQFTNLWNAAFFFNVDSDTKSNTYLRGGPTMHLPGELNANAFVSTSSRKKLRAEVSGGYHLGFEQSAENVRVDLEVEYKPLTNLTVAAYPEFMRRIGELQYVDHPSLDNLDRYIFGRIDQKVFGMSLRLDLILSPELTIQYWGQPFLAAGGYSDFKYITDPAADRFTDRFHLFGEEEIQYIGDEGVYQVTEASSGARYDFGNPDFNVREFLSNLVLRWEYRPGSFLYLVWTQNRSGFDAGGQFDFRNDFSSLWDLHPTDAVMVKLSYRLGR
ncbi:MAG: DUF5916 domain-containing protein [Bacteroidales bacterium]